VEPPRSASEFIEWLSDRHPPIAALRDEHVAYYEELLGHVLLGDVTRYAADLARRASVDMEAQWQLQGLLHDLDIALAGGTDDDAVQNLVAVSFIENAQGVAGDPEEALRGWIRDFPTLGRQMERVDPSGG
jgi:predicted hydrolase (HD superfamily)